MATLYSTYQAQANARDVSDFVTNISPKDSPLFSMLASNAGIARLKENVTDSLAAANKDNALAEGATLNDDTIQTRSIESNYMQIFKKVINVTGTQEAVAKYGGVQSELSYQIKKRFTELATDVEEAIIQGGSAAGSTAVARKLSGALEKITTNAITADITSATWVGTSESDLELFEDKLNDLFDQMWQNGERADTVLVGGRNKRRISKLSTKITRNVDAEKKTQILSINAYDSDFGPINIILDRYVPDANILALSLDMWEISYLRRFTQMKLAKTTDSTRIAVIGELTLDCKTEKAGGKITAS